MVGVEIVVMKVFGLMGIGMMMMMRWMKGLGREHVMER